MSDTRRASTQVATILLISNLHCPSCSRTISEILWRLFPSPFSVSTSIVTQIVTVTHNSFLLPRDIVWALLEAEYEIDSIALRDGAASIDPNFIFPGSEDEAIPLFLPDAESWLNEARRVVGNFVKGGYGRGHRHLDNCELCRRTEPSQLSHVETHSCAGEDDDIRHSHVEEDFRSSRILSEKAMSLRAEATPEDRVGDLEEAHKSRNTYETLLSIGGMTCSVCTGKVAETLQVFPFVKEVGINLMSNSGTVVFESTGDGMQEVAQLVDEIESIGYEAAMYRIKNLTPPAADLEITGVRQLALNVDGMCQSCPPAIVLALERTFMDLTIVAEPTVKTPLLRISYTPHQPDTTIRKIIDRIKATNPKFEISVYHPPTIEERSIMNQRRERNNYLIRLAFCTICAIPTFMIGVVWMALVPADHPIRMFLEEPIWIGSVSRIEWSLLIISTPVMFYCANPFHTRAIRETIAMWRPGSAVPFFRRFYRFGSMNLLISLGVSISYFSSIAMLGLAAAEDKHHMRSGHTTTYFDSTVFLTMFLLMGRYLEAYSKAKTANGINILASLRPKEAVLVESTEPETTPAGLESSLGLSPVQGVSEINPEYSDNRPVTLRRIPVDLLEVGDIVSVPKGASPPTDCTIVTGSSSFDESSLTGEPLLVSKYLGDDIFAGTINHGQAVNARVKKVAGESMIDDIVEVVREGQNKHAPIERIADRVTAYFVPAICGLAVCTWAVWLTVGLLEYIPNDYLDINEGGWYLWSLSFAIAVFVVACPCGIGLAAPCALHVGSGIASRHAILAKGGGEAFQEASLLDCVVFDKTGTLTQGVEPVITDEELLFQGDYAVRVIYLAARLLEESSSHPLARAIVSHCKEKPSINGQCNHAEEIAGKGTKGIIEVGGVIYEALIGNERFLNEHGAIGAGQYGEMLLTWKQQGKSVILFAIRSEEPSSVFGSEFTLTAIFATTDPIREEAPFVVRGLQSSGVDVWMITGDNITTATAVASQVGIPKDRVIAGVLPTEKADKVVELQSIATTGPRSTFSTILDRLRCRPTPERRAIVAMVGDGINDAPALSMADVGIAIGTGSDVAKQSAKFILVSSDLIGLLTLIDLSRAVVRRVKFNFFWACMFNLVAIPLAAGVLYPFTPQRIRLEPVWAALAMAMSSVSVIGSSLLLRSRLWGIGFRARKMRRYD